MKKAIFFLLLIFSHMACSEEVKLSCNMKRVNTDSLGSEKFNEQVIFEIMDTGKYKSIIPNSDEYGSVGTDKLGFRTSITDFSDANKWDITAYHDPKNGSNYTITIRIDRNTGTIFYQNNYTSPKGNIINISASGNCEKVNLTKKKF